MGITDEHKSIWEEIDRAESYLVCGMFDEAKSLASSILKRLIENCNSSSKDYKFSEGFANDCPDMLESAAMVLVQSMKSLQRTSEILKELKLLFGSLTAIPVQVFLTGVCFQMSERLSTISQGFLEEYLNNWRYVDDHYCPLLEAEASITDTEESCLMSSISVEEYLEVVELYVKTLLAAVKDTGPVIAWLEKATLPMEKRQELLRRLQSMSASAATSASQMAKSPELTDEYRSDFLQEPKPYNGHLKDIETNYLASRGNNRSKEEILKYSRQRVSCFWWFPTINLKLGSTRLAVPTGKMLLASLLLLIYYLTRKKQAVLKRFLAEKALLVKKAVFDLWQLAFSYQVNPLAAVQSLPTSTRGNR